MSEVGVDVVARARDETGPGLDSAARRLQGFGNEAGASGEKSGGRFAANFAGALVTGFAAAGLDRLLEETINAQRAGESVGRAFVSGLVEQLRNIPVAGALGELIPRTVDRLSGGDGLTFEERQQTLDAERRRRQKSSDDEERIRERLGEDQLTPEQLRRRRFGEQIRPMLQDVEDPTERRKLRERLLEEFQQREARDKKKQQEEERAEQEKEARKKREQEQEKLERERERERERRSREEERLAREREREEERLQRQAEQRERDLERGREVAARRQQALDDAENNIPSLVESRGLSGRAAAFRAARDPQVQQVILLTDVNTQLKELIRVNQQQLKQAEQAQLEVVGN